MMTPTCSALLLACAMPPERPDTALATALKSRTHAALQRAAERATELAVPGCAADSNLDFLAAALDQWETCSYRVAPGLAALTDAGSGRCSDLALYCWLTSAGVAGDWKLDVGADQIAFIGGIELILGGHVRCQSDGIACSIQTRGSTLDLHRETRSSRWRWRRMDAGMEGRHSVDGCQIYHASSPLLSPDLIDELSLADPRGAIAAIGQAFGLLAAASPSLAVWVKTVIAGIVLVADRIGMTRSGSSPNTPGLVFISHPIDVEHMAVLLVHEAAHNHYFLLAHHINLIEPGSREKLYSPFKSTDRPIERVLLALHACVNIARYTSVLRAQGVNHPVLTREHDSTMSAIEEMETSLEHAATLTDAGRALMTRMALRKS